MVYCKRTVYFYYIVQSAFISLLASDLSDSPSVQCSVYYTLVCCAVYSLLYNGAVSNLQCTVYCTLQWYSVICLLYSIQHAVYCTVYIVCSAFEALCSVGCVWLPCVTWDLEHDDSLYTLCSLFPAPYSSPSLLLTPVYHYPCYPDLWFQPCYPGPGNHCYTIHTLQSEHYTDRLYDCILAIDNILLLQQLLGPTLSSWPFWPMDKIFPRRLCAAVLVIIHTIIRKSEK